MDQITITLDGAEVSGHPGTTIFELANEVGVRIPTLCYDAHLSPLGACRVCMVEEETSGRLLASCVTPIAHGMVVNTRSRRVLENRRVIVELMLASHPDSCTVCDKGNRCMLRRIAADLGIGLLSFEKIPAYHPMVELNPFIQRDLSKCIRCGRCIRADQEIAVVGAIDYSHRGFEARPATLMDAPLERTECTFCGTCISVCPTGALSERFKISSLTSSRSTRTVCGLCGIGCEVLLDSRDTHIVGIRPGNVGESVNHISLCVKGHYGHDFINARERLTIPLVRKQGTLVAVSWEEALDVVASRLAELRQRRGSNSLGVIGASRCTNEENYLLQKFARTILGTNNIDSGARLRTSALSAGISKMLGYGAMTNPISDIRRAQEILVVGADPHNSAPIVGQMIRQAVRSGGANLTLVDVLPANLSAFASSWIRPHPGTYAVFLAGLLREVAELGRLRWDEFSRKGRVLEEVRKALESMTADRIESLTMIPARLITGIARRLSEAKNVAIVAGSGVAGEGGAFLSGAYMSALLLMTGHIGTDGSGLFPVAGSFNDQGAVDMGAGPRMLPGYRDVSDQAARDAFEDAWGAPVPHEEGMDYLSMIAAAYRGTMAGLYVVGEDPIRCCPGGATAREALSRLELLVVQDCFLTETAGMAHVVLPSVSLAEKEGTITTIERRVQKVRRAIDPVGSARPDVRIVLDLIARMGDAPPYGGPADVLNEIQNVVPMYRGITSDKLERGGVFWPCPHEKHPGTPVLYADGTTGGEGVAAFPSDLPVCVALEEKYPLWLLTGETLFHSRDSVYTEHSRILVRAANEGHIAMNPLDAGALGIGERDEARVHSRSGSLSTRVRYSNDMPRGIVRAVSVGSHSPCTLFAIEDRDPCHGMPQNHCLAVRVEAIT